MKHLLSIAFVAILFSCSKEEDPQPAAPSTTTPTTTPTTTMSTMEQSLVGNWIMDSTTSVNYNHQGDTTGTFTQKYNTPSTCKLLLKSDPGASQGYYKATNGIACSPTEMEWKYDGALLLGQYGYEVLQVSTSSLKFRYQSSPLSKITYHFHK